MTKQIEDDDGHCAGMYDLLDAVEAVIKASDPAKRDALAETSTPMLEAAWARSSSGLWGPQSPVLLHHLMSAIDAACRPETESKPRVPFDLSTAKPEGNA